jgi:hypothetical protein
VPTVNNLRAAYEKLRAERDATEPNDRYRFYDELNRLVDQITPEDVRRALKFFGAKGAVGSFSGGNDEGGYDDIKLVAEWHEPLDEDRLTADTVPNFTALDVEVPLWADWPESWDLLVLTERLERGLGNWGSFAGDFYVYGTVILDENGKGYVVAAERVDHYESYGETF